MARLRGHKERCEHATLGLLRELLQVRARLQLQASELRQLTQEVQQVTRSPEKEALEVRCSAELQTQVSHPFPGAWDSFPHSNPIDPVASSSVSTWSVLKGAQPAWPFFPPCSYLGPRARTRCKPWIKGTSPTHREGRRGRPQWTARGSCVLAVTGVRAHVGVLSPS